MPEAYRFRLPDGQTFQGTDLAAIKRAHPEAVITHGLEADNTGDLTVPVAYAGKQPGERAKPAADPPAAAEAPADAASAKAGGKAARGKQG